MNAILAGAQIYGAGAKGIAGSARHESRQKRWRAVICTGGCQRDRNRDKVGSSDTRDAAMAAAKRAIDNALDPKKRKLLPPT